MIPSFNKPSFSPCRLWRVFSGRLHQSEHRGVVCSVPSSSGCLFLRHSSAIELSSAILSPRLETSEKSLQLWMNPQISSLLQYLSTVIPSYLVRITLALRHSSSSRIISSIESWGIPPFHPPNLGRISRYMVMSSTIIASCITIDFQGIGKIISKRDVLPRLPFREQSIRKPGILVSTPHSIVAVQLGAYPWLLVS